MDTFNYDVFVSYAFETRTWVEDRVVRPLKLCRTLDGGLPRVFFDRDPKTGLKVGEAWPDALADAVRQSRKFVPIYSRGYFEKPMCLRELDTAYVNGTNTRDRLIYPVLMDLTAGDMIPVKMRSFQYVSVDAPDWFERLCDAIGLLPSAEVLTLRITTQMPPAVPVNNTLPRVAVEVLSDRAARGRDVEVTLSAKRGELRGELSVYSRNGVAVFDDLSFVAPSQRDVVLFATADGCVSDTSHPFRVTPPAPPAAVIAPAGRRVEAFGDPIFFASGDDVAQTAPRRVYARNDDTVVFADWAGRVTSIGRNGETHHWNCATREDGLTVAGGIVLSGDAIHAGFWDGAIYRLRVGQPPHLVHRHAQGVQGLAAIGDRLAFVDLDGGLFLHDANGVTGGVNTGEACIHGMTAVADSVVIAGDRRLLKYVPATRALLREPHRLGEIRGVLLDVAVPIICDVTGRGFRFDAGLTPRRRFQAPAGVRPMSADHAGDWAVCRQDDGASIVLYRHQVVYTHPGVVAVSPDGRTFAVAESEGLRLLDRAGMEALIGRRPDV